MSEFLKALGQALAQGGTTIGQGIGQAGQFRLEQKLREEAERRRLEQEEDRTAYQELQATVKNIQSFLSSGAIEEGSPLHETLTRAAERISAQGIQGASKLRGQLNSPEAMRFLGVGQATPEGQAGPQTPRGLAGFAGPQAQEAPAGPQAPSSLADALAQAGGVVQEHERGRAFADLTANELLTNLGQWKDNPEVVRVLAEAWLAGNPDAPEQARTAIAAAASLRAPEVRTPQEIAALSPEELHLNYGGFVRDGRVTEDAPEAFRRYAQSVNIGQVMAQGQAELSRRNALGELGLEGAQAQVATALVDLDQKRFNLDEAPKEAQRVAEQHRLEMGLGEAELRRVEQAIEQAGVVFEEGQRDRVHARIMSAVDSGSDAHLNEQERAAVAAYLGVEPDSEAYRAQLQGIAQGQLDTAASLRARTELENEALERGLDMQALELSRAEWELGRDRLMQPLTAGNDLNTVLFQAARQGDVGLLERYRAYLESDAFPEQRAALEQAGVTLADVETKLAQARDVALTDRQSREAHREMVQVELDRITMAREEDRLGLARDFASRFPDVAAMEGFLDSPEGRRFQAAYPGLVPHMEADVRWRALQEEKGRHVAAFDTLKGNPPDLEDPEAVRRHLGEMRDHLVAIGYSDEDAEMVAQAHVKAWQDGDAVLAAELAEKRARANLLNAQAAEARARGEAAVPAALAEQGVALAEAEIKGLEGMRKQLDDRADGLLGELQGKGCALPSTLQEAVGRQTVQAWTGRNTGPECDALWGRYEGVRLEQEHVTRVFAQYTGLRDYYVTGDPAELDTAPAEEDAAPAEASAPEPEASAPAGPAPQGRTRPKAPWETGSDPSTTPMGP